MPNSSPSLSTSPAATLSIDADSRLAHDLVLLQDLTLDASASAPLSVVALSDGIHLFAILEGTGAAHIPPDSQGSWGTSPTPLSGLSGTSEILAWPNSDGSAGILVVADGGIHAYCAVPSGGCTPVGDTLPAASQLGLASGRPYGVTSDGNLNVYGVDGGGSSALPIDLGGGLKNVDSVALVSATDAPWSSDPKWAIAGVTSGVMTVWLGFGGGYPEYQGTNNTGQLLYAFGGSDRAVFLSAQGLASFAFPQTDGQPIQDWTTQGLPWEQANWADYTTASAGFVGPDGLARLFVANQSDGTLWSMPQTGWDTQDPDLATWAPPFPLDLDVQGMAPAAAWGDGVLLGVVRADSSLDLLSQPVLDVSSWSRVTVQGTSTEPSWCNRYRTEVTVTDADGKPCAGTSLTLTPSTLVALEVEGVTVFAAPDAPAVLITNPTGQVTLTQPANGLDAVTFTLTADSAPDSQVAPHDYLHANLRAVPLAGAQEASIFTGSASVPPLSAASLGTLVPTASSDMVTVAATAIQTAMRLPTGQSSDLTGYEVDFRDPDNPVFTPYTSSDSLRARRGELSNLLVGDLWHDIAHSDIWRAIRSTAVKVVHWVVDIEHAVVSAVVRFGDAIEAQLDELAMDALHDIDKAVGFVHNILATIGAGIDKVIDWLKDLFSWEDIWNAMLALKGYLLDGNARAIQEINALSSDVKGICSRLQSDVDAAIDQTIDTLENKALGPPPSKSLPGSSCQRNWVHAKVATNAPSSDYGSVLPGDKATALVDSLLTSIGGTGGAATTVYNSLSSTVGTVIHPQVNLADVLLADVLKALKAVFDATVEAFDDVLTALLDVASDLLDAVQSALTTPLPDIPVITWLWKEISCTDEPLTLASLCCLVFAVPVDLGYKIIHDNRAPFPAPEEPVTGVNHSGAAAAAAVTEAGKDDGFDVIDEVNFILSLVMLGLDVVTDVRTASSNMTEEGPPLGSDVLLNWLDVAINGLCASTFLLATDKDTPNPTPPELRSLRVLGAYWVPVLIDMAFALVDTNYWRDQKAVPNVWPLQAALDGLSGAALAVAGGIVTGQCMHEEPPSATVLDVVEAAVGPLPWVTQFLLSEAVQMSTDPVPSISVGVQVAIDVIGDFDASDLSHAWP